MCFEKTCEAYIAYQEGNHYWVVLFEKDVKDWNKSVNYALIEEGLAKLDLDQYDDIPNEVSQNWQKVEDECKEEQVKIWKYGGGAVGESDEEET